MITSTLEPWQVGLLQQCPLTISTVKGQRLTGYEIERMKQLKILWAARFVSGKIVNADTALQFTLTDRGREVLAAEANKHFRNKLP
jgi:hypothetical protein